MTVASLPSRFLDSEDQFFKAIGYRREMYRLAYRQAAEEGLDGKQFNSRVSSLLREPTEEMHLAAVDAAEHQTFTNTPEGVFGAIAQMGTLGKQRAPILGFLMPFVRTPANLAAYTVDNLPGLQFAGTRLRRELTSGGPQTDMAMGRITMSLALLMAARSMYEAGDLSGEGPSNPRMKTYMPSAGRPPNSVRFGSKWYNFDRFDPLGAIMGGLADMFDALTYSKDPAAVTNTLLAATWGLAEDLSDSTYLQAVGNLIKSWKMGSEAGVVSGAKSFLGRTGGSFVPSISAFGARSMDVDHEGRALVRDAYTMTPNVGLFDAVVRQVKARTPFFREELPLAVDWKGDVQTRDYGGWWDEANPVKWSALHGDPAARALLENQVSVSKPRPTIRWSAGMSPMPGSTYIDEHGMPRGAYVDLLALDEGRGMIFEKYQQYIGQARYAAVRAAVGGRGRGGYNRAYASAKSKDKGIGSYWHDTLRNAVAQGTAQGKEEFIFWYLDQVEKGEPWPRPGSAEWDVMATDMRPQTTAPVPDTPPTPWRPEPERQQGTVRF